MRVFLFILHFIATTVIVIVEMRQLEGPVLIATKAVASLFLIVYLIVIYNKIEADSYFWFVALAIIFSVFGDVILTFHTDASFLAGMISFFIAHVFYVVAFSMLAPGFYWKDLILLVALIALGVLVLRTLSKGLGDLYIPVLGYLIVISLMAYRAGRTAYQISDNLPLIIFVCVGAVLFYISDVFIAWNKFKTPFSWHPLSLYLYYGGQTLLVFSTLLR